MKGSQQTSQLPSMHSSSAAHSWPHSPQLSSSVSRSCRPGERATTRGGESALQYSSPQLRRARDSADRQTDSHPQYLALVVNDGVSGISVATSFANQASLLMHGAKSRAARLQAKAVEALRPQGDPGAAQAACRRVGPKAGQVCCAWHDPAAQPHQKRIAPGRYRGSRTRPRRRDCCSCRS